MSEYQYVAFRAIDGPVSKKNLAFMERQSTRAEITEWSFENEYNFGDFRGNAEEMLRRGYDIHLHYANFGLRTLLIRLPGGFPDSKAAQPYLDDESVRFMKDQKGRGGILSISPFYESDDIEDLWDLGDLLDRLVPLRGEILEGDLRPLYLAHLAAACDSNHDPEETIEAPVPAGLGKLTDAQLALTELYGLSNALIEAAAQDGPETVPTMNRECQLKSWIGTQSQTVKDQWLAGLLEGASSAVRSEILMKFRDESGNSSWPVVELNRTVAQLRKSAEAIYQKEKAKAAAKAARQQAAKLKKMAADPTPFLKEAERLAAERNTDSYKKASRLLAELRTALAGTRQAGLAEKQAIQLKAKYPKLHHLTAALRREGFVPK